MKYYLHDTNAFNDEKVSELFLHYGYEGLGLFYTVLERIAMQEKPIKTEVLKAQLKVGKKLNKCWKFMEEIGLISSNNGETFNEQLLKFSEKYQIKKEKNKERVAQWRENQSDEKNVTHYEHVRNAPKVNISKVKESKVKVDDGIEPPPKIDISVSDAPKSEPKKSPPVPPTPPIGEVSIAQCVEWYKSQAYEGTRQTVCMAKYIDMETLLDWVDAFGLKLTGEGEVRKSVGDFASHFFRWMKFQKTDVNPKTLIHEQKESNGQQTNNNRNNKNATGPKVLNADYKADLFRRMAGDTSQGGDGGG